MMGTRKTAHKDCLFSTAQLFKDDSSFRISESNKHKKFSQIISQKVYFRSYAIIKCAKE